MAEAGETARYGVVGNPVAHSRSPEIHASFAAQFGAAIRYDKFLVEPEEFDRFVEDFKTSGGAGLNVTVPFKELAHAVVDARDELAAAAAAVNTIKVMADGSLHGFNTDGIGLVADLRANGVALENARVLLVGAGGAACGVVLPLLRAGIAVLTIANRTRARAEALVTAHAGLAGEVDIEALDFAAISQPADIVINATSLGLEGAVAPLPVQVVENAVCYDMSYGPAAHFAAWAARHGAAVCLDGLGMLVEQAAQSFYLWRGQRPQTAPVITTLRQSLQD